MKQEVKIIDNKEVDNLYNDIKLLLQKGLRKGSTYSQGGLVYSNWCKNYNEHKDKTKCVSAVQCEEGLIGNSEKGECTKCESGKYTSPNKTECVDKCETGYIGNSKKECEQCKVGKYANSKKTECVEASKCGEGYIGNKNRECEKCEEGTYANKDKTECIEEWMVSL